MNLKYEKRKSFIYCSAGKTQLHEMLIMFFLLLFSATFFMLVLYSKTPATPVQAGTSSNAILYYSDLSAAPVGGHVCFFGRNLWDVVPGDIYLVNSSGTEFLQNRRTFNNTMGTSEQGFCIEGILNTMTGTIVAARTKDGARVSNDIPFRITSGQTLMVAAAAQGAADCSSSGNSCTLDVALGIVQPGDQIIAIGTGSSGVYSGAVGANPNYVWDLSAGPAGTAAQPISIHPHAFQRPLINGQVLDRGGIYVTDPYWEIGGLEIIGSEGIMFDGAPNGRASNIELTRGTTGIGEGFRADASPDTIFYGNQVRGIGDSHIIAFNSNDVIIAYNDLGDQSVSNTGVIEIKSTSNYAVVHSNYIHNTGDYGDLIYMSGFELSGSSESKFYNNIVNDFHLGAWIENGENHLIYNNTFYTLAGSGIYWANSACFDISGVVKNNLFKGNGGIENPWNCIGANVTIDSDYNLYERADTRWEWGPATNGGVDFTEWQQDTLLYDSACGVGLSCDTSSIAGVDPEIANIAAEDFHIRTDSLARDAGDNQIISTSGYIDFDLPNDPSNSTDDGSHIYMVYRDQARGDPAIDDINVVKINKASGLITEHFIADAGVAYDITYDIFTNHLYIAGGRPSAGGGVPGPRFVERWNIGTMNRDFGWSFNGYSEGINGYYRGISISADMIGLVGEGGCAGFGQPHGALDIMNRVDGTIISALFCEEPNGYRNLSRIELYDDGFTGFHIVSGDNETQGTGNYQYTRNDPPCTDDLCATYSVQNAAGASGQISNGIQFTSDISAFFGIEGDGTLGTGPWIVEKRCSADGSLINGTNCSGLAEFGTGGVWTGPAILNASPKSMTWESGNIYISGSGTGSQTQILKINEVTGIDNSWGGSGDGIVRSTMSIYGNLIEADNAYLYVLGKHGTNYRLEKRRISDGALDGWTQVTMPPNNDYELNNRPLDGGWDIGAYEYVWNPVCGNDDVETAVGEECDGVDWNDVTPGPNDCTQIPGGFTGGSLACNPPGSGAGVECRWDTSACTLNVCPNGVVETGEDCDLPDWGALPTCQDHGFDGGAMACDAVCGYDTSGCFNYVCGDGTQDPGEECDDGDIGDTYGNGNTDDDTSCIIDPTRSMAYIANTGTLEIVNISNPAAPISAGSFNTTGTAYDVQVIGNIAYVADGSQGLRILNIANSASPTELGFVNTPGLSLGVTVVGNTAYVADGAGGLRIIDVTDPANPFELGFYMTPDNAEEVVIRGNLAYIAISSGASLQIIDISVPTIPGYVGSYDPTGFVRGLDVVGNYAYIAATSYGLYIADVSDPANPFELDQLQVGAPNSQKVKVRGNYAYIADGTDGFKIVDISNPSAAVLEGTYSTAGTAYDVFLDGNYAYLAYGGGGLEVVNITDPASPTQEGSLVIGSTARGVYTSDFMCLSNICGDGYFYSGVEECDDGNTANDDGCSATCALEFCGDGVQQAGEQCDSGDDLDTPEWINSTDNDEDCVIDSLNFVFCLNNVCGDGYLDDANFGGAEECDDGNTANGDGCSDTCTVEIICGDGSLDPGELCDPGPDPIDPGDDVFSDPFQDQCWEIDPLYVGGDLLCNLTCDGYDESQCLGAVCGNGIPEVGEDCDDGDFTDETYWTVDPNNDDGPCVMDASVPYVCMDNVCGDGYLWLFPGGPEECDDGDLLNINTCSDTCSITFCGDGVTQSPNGTGTGGPLNNGFEDCDDGNAIDDDDCSNTCVNNGCGDGVRQATLGEECDGADFGPGINDCSDYPGAYYPSPLNCFPQGHPQECEVDTSQCEFCGDGIYQQAQGEQCDPPDVICSTDPTNDCSDLIGNPCAGTCDPDVLWPLCSDAGYFGGGATACFVATCQHDVSMCHNCGNFAVDAGEICEQMVIADPFDDQFIPPLFCTDVGPYVGGDLQCNATCDGWDETLCSSAICGNGFVEGTEECDDGPDADNFDQCDTTDISGTGVCTLTFCGDNEIQGTTVAPFEGPNGFGVDEVCDDGNNIDGDGCSAVCLAEGCGDGLIQVSLGEECEDLDPNPDIFIVPITSCTDLLPSDLVCSTDATNDCRDLIGNPCGGTCDPVYYTVCDNDQSNDCADATQIANCTGTCISIYGAGDLECFPAGDPSGRECQIDIAQCNNCGNGIVEGPELCDKFNTPGADCTTEGFIGGQLQCNLLCNGYDTILCHSCGNGVIDAGEDCDIGDFGGEDCQSQGFDAGNLQCYGDCTIDFSQCVGTAVPWQPNNADSDLRPLDSNGLPNAGTWEVPEKNVVAIKSWVQNAGDLRSFLSVYTSPSTLDSYITRPGTGSKWACTFDISGSPDWNQIDCSACDPTNPASTWRFPFSWFDNNDLTNDYPDCDYDFDNDFATGNPVGSNAFWIWGNNCDPGGSRFVYCRLEFDANVPIDAAWNQNYGWVRTKVAGSRLGLNNTTMIMTGAAWNQNLGWLFFDASNAHDGSAPPVEVTGPVTIDVNGWLIGYAWGLNYGAVDLNPKSNGPCDPAIYECDDGWENGSCATCYRPYTGVHRDPITGILRGYAWSELAGWIDFGPFAQSIVIVP